MRSKVRLLTRLSIANVRRHRPRVLLIAVGIVLGVGSITAVLALSRSVTDTFATSVLHGAGAAQLQVSNGTAGLDRELVYAIARIPGVTATGATVQHHVLIPALDRRVTVFGVELGRDEAYREAQTGRDVADIPDALTFVAQPDSIALSSGLLAAKSLKSGDPIDVVGPKGSRTLRIRGAVHPHGILQAFGDDVALMDLDAAQLQFGASDRVHWIDVVVAPTADIEAVQASIAKILIGRGTIESPVARGRRIDVMLSLLRTLLTGTSVVAMLVGIFLIHHTLATSYRQRNPDFTRLRMLGLSRTWLTGYLVLEAAILGVASSILGVAVGIGFWLAATRDFSATISTLFIPVPIPAFNLSIG
jgi:putative ABC transport system permease protein